MIAAIVLVILGCGYGILLLAADLWIRRDYNDMVTLKTEVDKVLNQLITLVGPEAAIDLLNGDASLEIYEKEDNNTNE